MMSFISNRPLELVLSIIAQSACPGGRNVNSAADQPDMRSIGVAMAQALLSRNRELAIENFLKLQRLLLADAKRADDGLQPAASPGG